MLNLRIRNTHACSLFFIKYSNFKNLFHRRYLLQKFLKNKSYEIKVLNQVLKDLQITKFEKQQINLA